MEFKLALPIDLKRFIPLAVLVVLAVAAAFGFLILAKHIDGARQEFYDAQRELGLYRAGVWQLEKVDYTKLEEELTAFKQRFPSHEQVGMLIGELTGLAKGHHVAIEAITPSDKIVGREEDNLAFAVLDQVPVQMRLSGTYENLAAFLASLSNLEQSLMTVSQFQLGMGGGRDESMLQLSLNAVFFVKKKSDQDLLDSRAIPAVPKERLAQRSRFESTERNPFTERRLAPAAMVQDVIKLEGIIYDPVQPLVLINGVTWKKGDQVGAMKIVEIKPDRMIVEEDGKAREVRLG